MKKMTIEVVEPYKTFLTNGTKTVEGRLAKNKYAELAIGDQILIDDARFSIKNTRKYKSFAEMLSREGIYQVLPNIETIEDGIAVYRQFYSKEDEEKYGVLAIELTREIILHS